MVVIRIWGLHKPSCLPVYTTATSDTQDSMSLLFQACSPSSGSAVGTCSLLLISPPKFLTLAEVLHHNVISRRSNLLCCGPPTISPAPSTDPGTAWVLSKTSATLRLLLVLCNVFLGPGSVIVASLMPRRAPSTRCTFLNVNKWVPMFYRGEDRARRGGASQALQKSKAGLEPAPGTL